FLLRGEQRLAAADAGERAGALLVIERAAARPLGAVLAHDVILLRRQELPPLGVGVGHGIVLGVRLRAHVGALGGAARSLWWDDPKVVLAQQSATFRRHARACRGHPRLSISRRSKTWMAGTGPAMTII